MRSYPIILAGGIVVVYDFLESPVTASRMATLERFLQALPTAHQYVIYPIFIIERKPGGGLNGGTWRASSVRERFAGRERVTGVSLEELTSIVPVGEGLIGIPRNRWESDTPMSTVFHEIGHAVDYELGLTPAWLRSSHLAGVRPVCGGSNGVGRYAVEAYARWITNPSAVCRDLPTGESQIQADNRVFAALAATPAFRLVPNTWDPSRRRRRGGWAGAEAPAEARETR